MERFVIIKTEKSEKEMGDIFLTLSNEDIKIIRELNEKCTCLDNLYYDIEENAYSSVGDTNMIIVMVSNDVYVDLMLDFLLRNSIKFTYEDVSKSVKQDMFNLEEYIQNKCVTQN